MRRGTRFNLRRLRIATRLIISFALICGSLTIGVITALWQFEQMIGESERLARIDRRAASILRVNNDVLAFRDRVYSLVENGEAANLPGKIEPASTLLLEDVTRAIEALQDPESDHTDFRQVLAYIRSTVPAQIQSMQEIAQTGDLPALELRVSEQFRRISRDMALFTDRMDEEVSAESAEALRRIYEVQRSARGVLLVTTFVDLLFSAVLAFWVTASIAKPLARLQA